MMTFDAEGPHSPTKCMCNGSHPDKAQSSSLLPACRRQGLALCCWWSCYLLAPATCARHCRQQATPSVLLVARSAVLPEEATDWFTAFNLLLLGCTES